MPPANNIPADWAHLVRGAVEALCNANGIVFNQRTKLSTMIRGLVAIGVQPPAPVMPAVPVAPVPVPVLPLVPNQAVVPPVGPALVAPAPIPLAPLPPRRSNRVPVRNPLLAPAPAPIRAPNQRVVVLAVPAPPLPAVAPNMVIPAPPPAPVMAPPPPPPVLAPVAMAPPPPVFPVPIPPPPAPMVDPIPPINPIDGPNPILVAPNAPINPIAVPDGGAPAAPMAPIPPPVVPEVVGPIRGDMPPVIDLIYPEEADGLGDWMNEAPVPPVVPNVAPHINVVGVVPRAPYVPRLPPAPIQPAFNWPHVAPHVVPPVTPRTLYPVQQPIHAHNQYGYGEQGPLPVNGGRAPYSNLNSLAPPISSGYGPDPDWEASKRRKGDSPAFNLGCGRCSWESKDPTARFCGQCGFTMSVPMACTSCGAPVAANNAHCTSCGVQSGKRSITSSLIVPELSLFSDEMREISKSIYSHSYFDLAKLLPDYRKEIKIPLGDGSTINLTPNDSSNSKIPNVVLWIKAMDIMVDVGKRVDPRVGEDWAKYKTLIMEYSNLYKPWDIVYEYDVALRKFRASIGSSLFLEVDVALHSKLLSSHMTYQMRSILNEKGSSPFNPRSSRSSSSFSSSSTSNSSSSFVPSKFSKLGAKRYCFGFNAGDNHTPASCNYKHLCVLCDGSHPVSSCSSPDASSALSYVKAAQAKKKK
jgi:hypothetical protein